MLKNIKDEWSLLKKNMYMIGDSNVDIKCALNFNIKSFHYDGKNNLNEVLKENFFE